MTKVKSKNTVKRAKFETTQISLSFLPITFFLNFFSKLIKTNRELRTVDNWLKIVNSKLRVAISGNVDNDLGKVGFVLRKT
jgi:hypothetical protein